MSFASPATPPNPPALVSHVRAQHGPSLAVKLDELVEPFGGWSALVASDERIAVKINLLRAAPPEAAVCTHPETLRAVLRALKAQGARPFVADSPGGVNGPAKVARAFKLSGITAVCLEERVPIVDTEDDRATLHAPQGRLFRTFPYGRAFADADGIIQVGILKTHQLMRLTGGVKLTFGCIPGLAKAQLHVRAQRRDDFADMLVDLHTAVTPRFTIIDGIVAMEGQGPGSGDPRHLGSLFAAVDCHALDAALADRTDHARHAVYTLAAAEHRGLIDLADPYTRAGDPIPREVDFRPASRDLQELLPPTAHRAVRRLITARPQLVNSDACIKCGECANICGAQAIRLAPKPVFDDKRCVRCYACTEVCPVAALDSVPPPLARLASLSKH
ncbi:MAG: DUF362 domain-containing protein [Thermoleophilia bacterium]